MIVRDGSAGHLVEAIDSRLDRSPLAVMLDIDGTLAPIAPAPGEAVVPPTTRDVVQRLTELPDVHVALVSGRAAADAQRMLDVDAAWIIGNHGLELRPPRGEVSAVPEARAYENVIAGAYSILDAGACAVPGAKVENKRWTLTLHHRLASPSEAAPLIALARDLARDLGLRATEGKKVLELRPPLDINKGTAAAAFADRVGALERGSMLYAGDDQTDEDAFLALKGLGPRAVTVRVLEENEPVSGTLPTEASYTVGSPEELRRVLEWLVERRSA